MIHQTEYMSYTYCIGWSGLNRYYYGVRVANKCDPENDLWKEYFTSSKAVKEFREQYGEPDIIQVDRTFENSEQATEYEIKFLTENDCVYDDRWLNRSAFPLIDNRGRSRPDLKGKRRSKLIREKISKSLIGRSMPESVKEKLRGAKDQKFKEKCRQRQLGKTFTEQTKTKMSGAHKKRYENMSRQQRENLNSRISERLSGRSQEKIQCTKCNKVGGISNMKRYHFDNCKGKNDGTKKVFDDIISDTVN